MKRPLRVLIAEDNPTDAELIVRALRRADFEPEWERVDSEAEYRDRLRPNLDVILSDENMPPFSGTRALEVLQERGLDVPFIIISGTIGEEAAVEAMRRGAADYLLKDRLARLGSAVIQAMDQRRLRKEGIQAQEAIRQSEHKYRNLFESLSEAAFLIECSSRRIVEVNLCAEELLGRPRAEMLGMEESNLFPSSEAADCFRTLSSAVAKTWRGQSEEAAVVTKEGSRVPVRISVAPMELGGRAFVLVLMNDITERLQAEEAIRASLHEKEVLLKEVHHRVKNNLQIVTSLLNLQASQVNHPEALEALSESRNRIRTMALVHARLYQAETIGLLDLADYTRVLANELFSLYTGNAGAVALDFALAPMQIGIETAIPCALIINELLSNTFKHAFPGGRKGVTRLELAREGEIIRFSVKDNGIGFPTGYTVAESTSLGLQLVSDLARQLGGSFKIDSQPGDTHCHLMFPSERVHICNRIP